eukprot:gene58007-biopygen112844
MPTSSPSHGWTSTSLRCSPPQSIRTCLHRCCCNGNALSRTPSTQDDVNDLLCDINRHKNAPAGVSEVPSGAAFTMHGTTQLNTILGVAVSGVMLMNQMSIEYGERLTTNV